MPGQYLKSFPQVYCLSYSISNTSRPPTNIFTFRRHNSSSSSSSSSSTNVTTDTVLEATSSSNIPPPATSIPDIQTQLPSFDDVTASASSTMIDQTTQSVGELSNHIGYLNSIGMAQTWYWPADIIQHTLEYIHVYSGLPWWGTICVTTILIRLLMFPLYVKSSDTVARNSHIKPQLDKITKELMSSTDISKSQLLALERKKLLTENGIKTRWLMAPMLQLPLAIGFFNALRHMANHPVDGFTDQGIAWFQNLSLADPYLGLQFITAAVLISFTRLGGETGAQQFSPVMKRFFTILPLVSIPATMKLASAVVLYFAINGTFSVLQTMVLRNNWVRKQLKITDVKKQDQIQTTTVNGKAPAEENKGIWQSIRENMDNAKKQSEKRQFMKLKEEKLQKLIKEQNKNSKIKIVHKTQFKRNDDYQKRN
ncbi:membrane insertase OXA1 NDAI_0C05980 [Naumovozyma dairenensis CBS 421]|uniref:Membrane insertase YidC/Oxa/ALB C-terminal domain-containing protein n=1 Tax=Naumovozyma dairenensis (strain ATCC 10597 / BCRC 20456 / CBS 421 / NBRC 0211 / NRRL Y-12639) TaxID=1071378 RepID=G0W8Z6_NAUDC|nr:hypothetical protein NDAI_0C05980 [Naumovozyma dairenensis CBS 421]CCD24257.1 hypothetical protein NDAI_0C05980 [Naumovozyma dairenensis CBS 421]